MIKQKYVLLLVFIMSGSEAFHRQELSISLK